MIAGKLIGLRLITEKDLDELYVFHKDITNRGDYFPLEITPEPIYKAKFRETGFWTEDYSQLLIIHQNKVIGSIWTMKTISYFESLEIGYIIYDRANYGKGFATEALSLLVEYLFKVKVLNRLEIRVLSSHTASEKVALKCGFTFEGIIRKAIFHHGQYQDLRQFSLLRNDVINTHVVRRNI